MITFEPKIEHAAVWLRMQALFEKNCIPHALLFVGPRYAHILSFVHRFLIFLLCTHDEKPCGICQACHWVLHHQHPDLQFVTSASSSAVIKIDQIRELQHTIYNTPQQATHRYVIIESADQLNTAAANALLKILEEPPDHVRFILISTHLSALPLTIISRCQVHTFPDSLVSHYLAQGALYDQTSTRGQLYADKDLLLKELCDLMMKKTTPCALAQRWSSYVWEDVLWFLYLVIAQLMRNQYVTQEPERPSDEGMNLLSTLCQPIKLFSLFDQVSSFLHHAQSGLNLNHTLALETLFTMI